MQGDHNYWIKDGLWIPVSADHYTDIVQSPEQFGLTKESIEKLRTSGSSGGSGGSDSSDAVAGPVRDEVIRKATENGWIRIRTFAGAGTDAGERIVIQGHQMDTRTSEIQDAVTQLRTRKAIDGTVAVTISDTATGESRTFQVGPDTSDALQEAVDGDLELS